MEEEWLTTGCGNPTSNGFPFILRKPAVQCLLISRVDMVLLLAYKRIFVILYFESLLKGYKIAKVIIKKILANMT